MLRAAQFLHRYLRPRADIAGTEVRLESEGGGGQATCYAPLGRGRRPGWIVLHGITTAGRHHPSLIRFARAAAAAGRVVLVPEVPSWRALEIDVEAARAAIDVGARYFSGRPEVEPGRVGVVGFSFGATHALIAAADPALRARVGGVVGFGGYADLRSAFRFGFSGRHQWGDREYRLRPDPYGIWIVTANYLPHARGYEGLTGVARAAGEMAREAGRRMTYAGGAEYDPLKIELARQLTAEEREVWRSIAPLASEPLPAPEETLPLADALTEAALAVQPELDPAPRVGSVRARVVLGHGFSDRLIPFSESHRLAALLPAGRTAEPTITRYLAHSGEDESLSGPRRAVEAVRFVRLVDRALTVV